ncbi:MAG: hypothetical protein JO157_10505 [Acetobacteraceae bacterium]|nr:hypothetical protein [Acetobacteraceae bacterium]
MAAQLPPVPPAARSPKGTGEGGHEAKPHEPQHHVHDSNTHEQGEPGNMHQNTTNQGYQQDR